MANDFYQHSGHPGTRAPRSSALLRAEFSAIEDGFDKLPDVGTANLFSVSDGSALVGKTSAQAKVILALENVTNTADADKPISTLTQAALNLKANLHSPALTGNPTAPDVAVNVYNNSICNTAVAESMVRHLLESHYFEGPGTANGWRRFRDNLCLQWGLTLAPASAGSEHGTLFPISFTAAPHAVLCTGRTSSATANSVWVTGVFASYFNARASLASQSYHWWAIGPLA